jgi:hypothetical protein
MDDTEVPRLMFGGREIKPDADGWYHVRIKRDLKSIPIYIWDDKAKDWIAVGGGDPITRKIIWRGSNDGDT